MFAAHVADHGKLRGFRDAGPCRTRPRGHDQCVGCYDGGNPPAPGLVWEVMRPLKITYQIPYSRRLAHVWLAMIERYRAAEMRTCGGTYPTRWFERRVGVNGCPEKMIRLSFLVHFRPDSELDLRSARPVAICACKACGVTARECSPLLRTTLKKAPSTFESTMTP